MTCTIHVGDKQCTLDALAIEILLQATIECLRAAGLQFYLEWNY